MARKSALIPLTHAAHQLGYLKRPTLTGTGLTTRQLGLRMGIKNFAKIRPNGRGFQAFVRKEDLQNIPPCNGAKVAEPKAAQAPITASVQIDPIQLQLAALSEKVDKLCKVWGIA